MGSSIGNRKAWPERKEDLMKQLMSYYVMDDDTDEKIREMTDNLGLDGIESLVYGTNQEIFPGKNRLSDATLITGLTG